MAQSIVNDIDISSELPAKIKVIGVGGGGGNAVQHMIASGLRGVQFICANTDLQHLKKMDAPFKIQLGEKLTKGLGAGSMPAVGQDAAIESKASIRDALAETDMVFVTAGMGGGTGTGAAPVIAQIAKEMGALTVGVVTMPFAYEGKKRKMAAENGLENLRQHVDSLLIVPNDRLVPFAPKNTPFKALLQQANNVLYYAVKGISDVIVAPAVLNVDFADVRTAMSEAGLALMGTGIASGENRAREATQRAIMSPLLENVSLESAKAVLYNITAADDITGQEIQEIGDIIAEAAPEDVNIKFGLLFDEDLGDEIRVTVIATGIEPAVPVKQLPGKVTVLNPDLGRNGRGTQTFGGPRPYGEDRNTLTPEPATNGAWRGKPHDEDRSTPPVRRRPPSPQPERYTSGDGFIFEPLPGLENYTDIPTFQRQKRRGQATEALHGRMLSMNEAPRHEPGQVDHCYFGDDPDVPAFLRTQAD
ncbi:MAG: cell division protein FtsZ [Desulfovibrio sp.]|jgi:cell division protein FtsZ|nr:cell division protein FtsZ [Desulfovibrio sp.]